MNILKITRPQKISLFSQIHSFKTLILNRINPELIIAYSKKKLNTILDKFKCFLKIFSDMQILNHEIHTQLKNKYTFNNKKFSSFKNIIKFS